MVQIGQRVTLSNDQRMTDDLHGLSGTISEVRECRDGWGRPYRRVIVSLDVAHRMNAVQFDEDESHWMLR